MNWYIFNTETPETKLFFKEGSWYKGKGTEKGITAKYSGNPSSNHGWWSGVFVSNYFRLITPELWDEITDLKEIEELELKLEQELKQH